MEPLFYGIQALMPSLTVKNIPEDLYEQLKHAANAHHRSINSELINCLEKTLLPRKITQQERLDSARALRSQVNATVIDAAELDEAKRAGRA